MLRSSCFYTNIAFSPNYKLIAVGGRDRVQIWNIETGKIIQKVEKFFNINFHLHLDSIGSVCFSRDSKNLLTTGGDGFIQIWDVDTGKHAHTLRGNSKAISFFASQDSKVLAAWCSEKKNNRYEQTLEVFGL